MTFAVVLAWVSSSVPAATLFVNSNAAPGGTGTSWANAFPDLQSALAAAEPNSNMEIWVAAGTYKPAQPIGGTDDRFKSFQLKNGVALYGGFNGTETDRSRRNWLLNKTILSGDLNGDDSDVVAHDEPTRQDNAYHVFFHPEDWTLDPTAILDGFIITAGNANENGGIFGKGGGICTYGQARPTIANCTFIANSANSGGALYNYTNSGPIVEHCLFHTNTARYHGGGVLNSTSAATITSCVFTNNTAGYSGGGLCNYNTEPDKLSITQCVFADNTALNGAGMYNDNANPAITNCTFTNNAAVGDGGGIYVDNANPIVTNCILWANTAGDLGTQIFTAFNAAITVSNSCIQDGWAGTGNIDSDPQFVDSANGSLQLKASSPCIDKGNNTAIAADITCDLFGSPRIIDANCDSIAIVDMGAYEYYLPGDVNLSCSVDSLDLTQFITHWLQTRCTRPDNCSGADIDRNGSVTLPDFALLAEYWLK